MKRFYGAHWAEDPPGAAENSLISVRRSLLWRHVEVGLPAPVRHYGRPGPRWAGVSVGVREA